MLVFALVTFLPSRAEAYPWMIRHDYTACGMCHADPSGAGLLTAYGRAQSEVFMRTKWSSPAGEEEDPGKLGDFAFGAIPLPEQLLLQADMRGLYMHVAPPSPAPSVDRFILMQADVAAGVSAGKLRAAGSLGYAHEGALGASVTRGTEDRLVSRQHWVGVTLGDDDTVLLRAGRMNLPYGLRVIEHTSFVRASTRTDINAAQQHGVAVAYTPEGWRMEAMAILGNFQLRPDDLRERGVAGYVEKSFGQNLAVGVTTLVTHAAYEPEARTSAFRQAHGLFGRWAIAKPVVIMAEADLVVRSPKRRAIDVGSTSFLQVDVEPVQGVHLAATGEMQTTRIGPDATSFGGWLSAFWFFLPHTDVRADLVYRDIAAGPSRAPVLTYLAQIHGWL